MVDIIRYDPFREVISLRDAINRLFEESFVAPGWRWDEASATIPINVRENEHGYQVQAQIPGVKPEQLEVNVTGNTLTLKAEVPREEVEEQRGQWHVREIRSGSFARTITFPKDIDSGKIEARYENGVLTVNVPFGEASKPKKIRVKAA
ncbi:MAG: Hsp20/alpha crystallin family protein [Thermogemmatispora sp.]|uniref:Hsp20/alpha crystallin family protein n=1 Tax=Thermogemmatispora sp. TaxID=1968838 RepID=UPI0026184D69|nr:Hsp20/alpha crystallin family protein [Thermogemmatispora sp.]MBX5455911.1 Hsp20/alpha crystallin family protein [Thermogemmatispora sp.]